MEEKVSIIVPVYNGEKYLERCLESIINQTYKNIEIICINDGSTDESKNILKQYQLKDNRIIVKNFQNGGVSRARNIGIRKATGDFFMFVDSDDYIELNMVDKMMETIKKQDADVVRCTNFLEKQNGESIKVEDFEIKNMLLSKDKIDETILSKIILGELLTYSCVLIIKKDILLKTNLFNEKQKILEDKTFYLELFLVSKTIYFLDIPLYHYVENGESCTNSKKLVTRHMYDLLEGWNYIREILENSKCESLNLFVHLNTKYLLGVTGYLYETYVYNKTEFKKAYYDLINNENFKSMIKNYNVKQYGIHIKISIKLIIQKKYLLLRSFYCIRNILKNVLSKNNIS